MVASIEIPISILHNRNLSWAAKGLLAYLLSREKPFVYGKSTLRKEKRKRTHCNCVGI